MSSSRHVAGSVYAARERARVCFVTGVQDPLVGEITHVVLNFPQRPASVPMPEHRPKVRLRVLREATSRGREAHCEVEMEQTLIRTVPTMKLRYGPLQKAGSFLLSIEVDRVPVTGSPFVLRCRPGPANACTSSFDEGAVSTRAGECLRLTMTTRDSFRNRCDQGGAQVTIHDMHPESDPERSAQCSLDMSDGIRVVDEQNGRFTVCMTLTLVGVRRFLARIGGQPLGSLVEVLVQPAPLHAPSCLVRGEALECFLATGVPSSLQLTSRDAFGNECKRGGRSWAASLELRDRDCGSWRVVDGAASVEELTDQAGEYIVHILVHRAGPCRLTLRPILHGIPVSEALSIGLLACPSPEDPHAFSICGRDCRTAVAGEPTEVIVRPHSFGHARMLAARTFDGMRAWLAWPASGAGSGDEGVQPLCGTRRGAEAPNEEEATEGVLVPQALGGKLAVAQWHGLRAPSLLECSSEDVLDREEWAFRYTPTRATRSGAIHVELFGCPIGNSPYPCTIFPATTTPSKTVVWFDRSRVRAGEPINGHITACDRFGNARWSGGDDVRVMLLRASSTTNGGRSNEPTTMDLAASPTTKHYRSRSGDALVSEAAARDSETVFALSTSASAATLAKHLLSADQVESGPPEGNCAAAMKDEHVGTASSSSATALPNDEAHRVLPRSPSVAAAAAVILAGQIRRDGSMASEDAPMNEDAQVRESIPPVDDSIHGLKKRGASSAGCEVADGEDGTYRSTTVVLATGSYSLHVFVNDQPAAPPWAFTVLPGVPDAAMSELHVGQMCGTIGRSVPVSILTRDSFGNVVASAYDSGESTDESGVWSAGQTDRRSVNKDGGIEVHIISGEGRTMPIKSRGHGRYQSAVSAVTSCRLQVAVTIGAMPLRGSPFEIDINAGALVHTCLHGHDPSNADVMHWSASTGATSASASFAEGTGWQRRILVGDEVEFRIHAYDAQGNPQNRNFDQFRVALTPRARGYKLVELFPHSVNSGLYSCRYQLPRPGSYVLSVTLKGYHIKESPFNIVAGNGSFSDVLAQHPSLSSSMNDLQPFDAARSSPFISRKCDLAQSSPSASRASHAASSPLPMRSPKPSQAASYLHASSSQFKTQEAEVIAAQMGMIRSQPTITPSRSLQAIVAAAGSVADNRAATPRGQRKVRFNASSSGELACSVKQVSVRPSSKAKEKQMRRPPWGVAYAGGGLQ